MNLIDAIADASAMIFLAIFLIVILQLILWLITKPKKRYFEVQKLFDFGYEKVRYKCNKCNKIYKTIVKPGIVFDKYKHHTITIYSDCGKHKDRMV